MDAPQTSQEDLSQKLPRILTHEAGHAIVAWQSPLILKVQRVLVDPGRRRADCKLHFRDYRSPSDHLERAVIAMGGMAAEELRLGGFLAYISAQDLDVATRSAYNARHLGMSWRRRPRPTAFYAQVQRYVPRDCQAFVEHAFALARRRLESRRDDLESLYEELQRNRRFGRTVLSGFRLKTILGRRPEAVREGLR